MPRTLDEGHAPSTGAPPTRLVVGLVLAMTAGASIGFFVVGQVYGTHAADACSIQDRGVSCGSFAPHAPRPVWVDVAGAAVGALLGLLLGRLRTRGSAPDGRRPGARTDVVVAAALTGAGLCYLLVDPVAGPPAFADPCSDGSCLGVGHTARPWWVDASAAAAGAAIGALLARGATRGS